MTLLTTARSDRARDDADRASRDTMKRWIHVPTPGDHYSPATGSAIITVIYELSRQHLQSGGEVTIVVGRGTRHDYSVGGCVEVDFGRLPSRPKKLLDSAVGRLGVPRLFARSVYYPAVGAIPVGFDGVVFLYNAAAAVPLIKRHAPKARVCLYCQNDLFRSYADREVRAVVSCSDRVVAVSDFIANSIRHRIGRNDPRIITVCNGVDTQRFVPRAEDASNPVPVILFLGRVHPLKGPDLLIKAARMIHGPDRRFKVMIVGSQGFSASDPLTPYEASLRELAAPLGDDVAFTPFVDRSRVVDFYQGADVFCAPSNWDDPCPLIVPEAMACGLPVVTSRRGGIPQAAGDSVLYFDPPDVDALAGQLTRLLDDETLRRTLGLRARQRAETLDWTCRYRALVNQIVSQ